MLTFPTRNWHLTRAGWLWLFLAVSLLSLGVVKNINLLTMLGSALIALLLLGGFVVGRRFHRLQAVRHLDVMLFAGTTSHVELRLNNRGDHACRGVSLRDEAAGTEIRWYFDSIDAHQRTTCSAEVRLPGRGWHDWGPLEAPSTHPFGLVRRRVELLPLTRVLVLPLPGKLDREKLRQQLRGADPRGERVRRRGWRHEGAQADFHGLRPFRPGDSPRWIHWRTTARRGELMVREFEDVPGDDLILVLASCRGAREVEAVVTTAASVCWEWCRRRGDRLILLAGKTLLDGLTGPEHARELLEALAVLPDEFIPEPDLAGLNDLPARLAIVVIDPVGVEITGDLAALPAGRVTVLSAARQMIDEERSEGEAWTEK